MRQLSPASVDAITNARSLLGACFSWLDSWDAGKLLHPTPDLARLANTLQPSLCETNSSISSQPGFGQRVREGIAMQARSRSMHPDPHLADDPILNYLKKNQTALNSGSTCPVPNRPTNQTQVQLIRCPSSTTALRWALRSRHLVAQSHVIVHITCNLLNFANLW